MAELESLTSPVLNLCLKSEFLGEIAPTLLCKCPIGLDNSIVVLVVHQIREVQTRLLLERGFRFLTKRELLLWIHFVFSLSEKKTLNEWIPEDGILFLNAVV